MEEKKLPNLKTEIEELEAQLLSEDNIENIRAIIDLFNINIQKKNIIRKNKLTELQNKVYDQLEERVSTGANTFSNKDLLDCFKVIQDTISKTEVDTDQIQTPHIQLNQNNLNINLGAELNRESRQRITDVIKNIIDNNSSIDVIDMQETEKEKSEG